MVCLYVTSLEEAGGKTALCAGIGRYLQESGKSVGYLRPSAGGVVVGPDVSFMKQVLSQEASEDILGPAPDKIKAAYAQVSKGRDVVLVEGATGEADSALPDALDARVIVIANYASELPLAVIEGYGRKYGQRLLGVVVNRVPRTRLAQVDSQMAGAGIKYLGSLPESRALAGLTVAELAEHLQGELLNDQWKTAELVENIMLGAMVVGSGVLYFQRKANKAAVVRSGRPDMQLAALETPTACLVSTGGSDLSEVVVHRAGEKQVPIITTGEGTAAVVAAIEAALEESRFGQEKKVPIIAGIVKEALDIDALAR